MKYNKLLDIFYRIVNFICGKENNKLKDIIKICIYILLGIFFIYKVNFYTDKVARFPDELAHVSYVSYLEKTDEFIPNFEEMEMLSSGIDLNADKSTSQFEKGSLNYLGHPPLYYQILKLSGAVIVDGDDVTVNMKLLRSITHVIGYLGMALAFYIGYRKIKRLILNVLYGIIMVMVPMMAYSVGGINNDTLCFLTVNILLLGLIFFSEEKRGYPTYLLIAIGVFATVLTKLTAGLIIMIAGIIYILYTIIKERSFKIVTCKEFLVTLPLYVCVLAYFMYIYYKHGTIMPSLASMSPEYFKSSQFYVKEANRIHMNFSQYYEYYSKRFLDTWSGIHSHVALEKREGIDDNLIKAYASILILPILGIISMNKDKVKKVFTFVYIGIVVAIVYQFISAYGAFTNNGYRGGFQSRYYLCALVSIAILICYFIDYIYELIEKNTINKYICCIILCVITLIVIKYMYTLYLGDLPYFDKRFVNYL